MKIGYIMGNLAQIYCSRWKPGTCPLLCLSDTWNRIIE